MIRRASAAAIQSRGRNAFPESTATTGRLLRKLWRVANLVARSRRFSAIPDSLALGFLLAFKSSSPRNAATSTRDACATRFSLKSLLPVLRTFFAMPEKSSLWKEWRQCSYNSTYCETTERSECNEVPGQAEAAQYLQSRGSLSPCRLAFHPDRDSGLPFFGIPNWAIRLVVLKLLIGFAMTLLLSWAFELTPEGLKRTENVLGSAPRARTEL